MKEEKSILVTELETMLRAPLSAAIREYWKIEEFRYEELTCSEKDQYILEVVNTLFDNAVPVAGQARQPAWETGWHQNLEAFMRTRDPRALVPGYHGKHRVLRWQQRPIRPLVPNLDYNILCLLVDWAVEKFFAKASAIMEFGCGPAYHLLRARRYNSTARLVGMDWAAASQEIITAVRTCGIDSNIEGHPFDFFCPNNDLEVRPNSGVLTVAALEQVGERFGPFLEFLLNKRPSICVHFEPINELMDANNLIDRLSLLYCRKRNYLSGFLTALRQLQKEGKVRILREQRTYTGSFFAETHSLVVWTPV